MVGADYIKLIWVPDTFFVNEKEARFHAATQVISCFVVFFSFSLYFLLLFCGDGNGVPGTLFVVFFISSCFDVVVVVVFSTF